MKLIYVTADPVTCGWLESILQSAGVECLVRNRYLGGAIGELPLNEAWPEIWVVDADDENRARRLIDAALEPQPRRSEWRCGQCGEVSEGQFRQCWQCGAEPPGGA